MKKPEKKYAVIFKAEIKELDGEYSETLAVLRAMAVDHYGCLDIASTTEGDNEITISYWKSLEDIKRWRADVKHKRAQQLGRDKWYKSYRVQVVEVIRDYSHE
jgi:heme-degrading monooxygenase HmoA